MGDTAIASSSRQGLHAKAALEADALDVWLSGTADVNVRPQLDSFLSDVHAKAAQAGVASVNVDISALEFINSSCLKCFISWMTTAQSMNEGRYMITFLFQPLLPRQARSFGVLATLGGDNVRLRAKDGP